jgi:hypothetical protein
MLVEHEILADRGYFDSEEILACEEAGISAPNQLIRNAMNQASAPLRILNVDWT